MAFSGHRWQYYRASVAICEYLIRMLSSGSLPEPMASVYLNDLKMIESLIDQLDFNSACEHAVNLIGKVQSDLAGGAINQSQAEGLVEPCTRLAELLQD